MTTTPLPPLPRACIYSINDNPAFDEPKGYGAHQMQSYATQARADLEAEVARLRAQMQTIKDYAGNPEIVWKTAVAALEKQHD